MRDIMLDLETMGTGPDAAILAIGAVAFDPDRGELGEEFYQVVSLESAVACGGTITPSTVLWWMQQSDAARAEFGREGGNIARVLSNFREYAHRIEVENNLRVWGNGANFDNVILRSAFERAALQTPWMFWNDRCFRTAKALLPQVEVLFKGEKHNALADANWQAAYLMTAMNAWE